MWGHSHFLTFQGANQHKSFLGGCCAIPVYLAILAFSIHQAFAMLSITNSQYNTVHMDWQKPVSIATLQTEIGYVIMNQNNEIVPLDEQLYEVEFVKEQSSPSHRVSTVLESSVCAVKPHNINETLQDAKCVSKSETLQNKWLGKGQSLKLQVKRCDESKGGVCYTGMERTQQVKKAGPMSVILFYKQKSFGVDW